MLKFNSFKITFFTPPLLFITLAFIITAIWFGQGLIYGGAEVGLLTYNPARWLDIQKYLWWEAIAPGWPIPHFLNAIPIYFVLSVLQLIFQSPVILQAILFFVLLFMMGYGMYRFSLSILGKDRQDYAILSGLFYMFNPYVVVDIWHRFVYTGFFLAAFLPFLALFWKNWISKGSFLFLFLFLLANFLASYMFGSISILIAVWLLLAFLSIPFMIFPWKGIYNFLTVSKRFILGFVLWVLINIWWLYPVATNTSLLSESHSSEVNLTTLVNISRKTILPYTLQLTNPYYLFFTAELGEAYKLFPITLIPWIATVFIGVGIIAALRSLGLAQYATGYLISIVLSKGVAIPFSALFFFGFTYFYFLGVLRNPYEKLGILLPFFGSILFCLGVEKIKSWGGRKIGRGSINVILIMILVFFFGYSLPMFTGKIFGNKRYPLTVEVPKYYKEADEWLSEYKTREGNILHLPFSGRDVVTYEWDVGYHGVEINELLFTSHPSISRKVGMKTADKLLDSLTLFFTPPFSSDKEQILSLLQNLSVRFIVLHRDTNWLDIDTYGNTIKQNNPTEVAKVLDELPFLEKVSTFGSLDIYKIKDSFYRNKIFLSNEVQLVYPGNVSPLHLLKYTKNKGDIISPQDNSEALSAGEFRQMLIFPKDLYSFKKLSDTALENLLKTNLLDSLKKIADYFDQSGELESRDRAESLMQATEVLLKNENFQSYEDLMQQVFKNDFKNSSLVKLYRDILSDIFGLHIYILDQNKDKLGVEARERLKGNLTASNFMPGYEFPSSDEKSKKIFQFKIPENATYELMIDDFGSFDTYPDISSNIDFNLNAKPINYGEINLDKGDYEISYNELMSTNLVEPAATILTALGEDAFIETPIAGVSGGDKFHINFEGLLENGNIFYILIASDIEYQENGNQRLSLLHQCIVHVCYPLKPSENTPGWQKFTLTTQNLDPSVQKANIRILVPQGNKLNIKNLEVRKVLDNTLYLTKTFSNSDAKLSGEVTSMTRNSPVFYSGKIRLEQPSFIFLNQTFHPKWSLRLKNADTNFLVKDHFIGNYFANAWYIEREGEYDFEIKFDPQENVNKGMVVSGVTFIGILIAIIFPKFKRI